MGLYHVPLIARLSTRSYGCMCTFSVTWHWTDRDKNMTKGMCCVIHVLVSVGFTVEIVMVKYHDCTL